MAACTAGRGDWGADVGLGGLCARARRSHAPSGAISSRETLRPLRHNCGYDRRRHCNDVSFGAGRVLQGLPAHKDCLPLSAAELIACDRGKSQPPRFRARDQRRSMQ